MVFYLDHSRFRGVTQHTNRNAAIGIRIFDGVIEEVDENLAEDSGVPLHVYGFISGDRYDLSLLLGQDVEKRDRILGECDEANAVASQLNLTRIRASDVQQAIDKASETS